MQYSWLVSEIKGLNTKRGNSFTESMCSLKMGQLESKHSWKLVGHMNLGAL